MQRSAAEPDVVPRPRHTLVTGASGGLGAALARELARRGDRLTLLGRDGQRLAATASACGRGVATAPDVVTCDVLDADAMQHTLLQADNGQPVDLIIANAGKGGRDVMAPPSGEPLHLAREIIGVNVLGVVNTVTPLLERLVARRRGHIVIISSMAARHGLAEAPAYAASKAAVSTYGHGLRRLLSRHGVAVTVVEPGYITTPMSASLPYHRPYEVGADRAAALIMRAVDRGAHHVAFPWQMSWGSSLLSLLPSRLADRVLDLASSRTRLEP